MIGSESVYSELLQDVESLQDYESDKISFDSQLLVIEMRRTFSRSRPPNPIFINHHVWDNFYKTKMENTDAKISNHVFVASYYKDDWLSFEKAAEAIDTLRSTKFSTGVPSPPVILLGITRNVIHSGVANKSVSSEDALTLASKYSAASVETAIENKRFANKDVYTAIAAARPLTDGNEKA